MIRNRTPAFVLGGLVVVALSLAAGFVGATLAPPPPSTAPPPRAVADSVVNGRLNEFERRLDNIDERLRGVEETAARNAERLGEIDVLRRQLSELRGAAPLDKPLVPPDDAAAPTTADASVAEHVPTDAERVARTREEARRIVTEHAPKLLRHRLAMIAKTGVDADAARRTQTAIEARQLVREYALPDAKLDEIQAILDEEMETSVREVAPYLTGGLDNADYGQVKEKLDAIWDHRATQMSDVLNADDFKDWSASYKEWRKLLAHALEQFEQARLDHR